MIFKPMLASPAIDQLLRFPLLASPKLDGVRAIVRNGIVLSRSLKPIPNSHVQKRFSHLEHFDGELIIGAANDPHVLRNTTSGVMTTDGEPDVTYHVFDHIEAHGDRYVDRYNRVAYALRDGLAHTELVRTVPVTSAACLHEFERSVLKCGYEGVMLRDPNGHYKFGRSTSREGLLMKVKRFIDGEFEIVGFEERMHNANEATVSELGRTKRSTHKANKHSRGDLGALILKYGDTTFNCGTGFTDEERALIWANQDKYLGNLAKVKYFAYGIKDVPKLPAFLGIRARRDM